MNTTLPDLPERASVARQESTDAPGQVVTYTCQAGFVFLGDPVTATVAQPTTTSTTTTTTTTTTESTTTSAAWNWISFMGAEYAKVQHASDLTWAQARSFCQEAGGDLVSIRTWPEMWKINDAFGTSGDRWIGLTDAASEGTWKWVDTTDIQFKYWDGCHIPASSSSKNCAIIKHSSDGRWDDKACDESGIDKFICQKGRSTSSFWNTIYGAEYSYMKHRDCLRSWQNAKSFCEAHGGHLASILSQSVVDGYTRLFGDALESHYYIGLNDIQNEGFMR